MPVEPIRARRLLETARSCKNLAKNLGWINVTSSDRSDTAGRPGHLASGNFAADLFQDVTNGNRLFTLVHYSANEAAVHCN